ncbi:MAG TPA: glycosyltransferase [Isosphaeraceae bacterium]|nr:glycosyltransferase [Isosphaeraceae bacterium]
MSTIAICIWPMPSSLLSAVGLAKRLRRRGHRVCIISTPDVESSARAEDIEFVPVLAGLFPAGSWVAQTRFYTTLSRIGLLHEIRRTVRHYRAIIDGLLASEQNEIDQAFERIAPDLVLIYADFPVPAVAGLMALRRGIRCAYVTSIFYHYRGPASPPLSSGLVPRPEGWSRLLVRLAWARFHLARRVRARLGIALGLDLDLLHILRTLSRQAGGAGWPLEWDCFLAPMLRLPEFFLTPRELDFPIEPRDGSHWLGRGDDDRVEEPFPWERVDSSRQLVYCALGTQLFLPLDRQRAFLQAVIDALAARPHLQLALATGAYVMQTDLVVRAPDAIVLERMPQLQVLRRARLMITHSGTNSVLECAHRGVPMITFPLGFDQFGNAARVVYHRLGLRGDIRRATADEIGRLIDAVVEDEAMRRRCAAMSALSRDQDRYEAGMRTLEALAKRP